MCKGVEALSNEVGGSKKVAILQSKVKRGSNQIKLVRSSEAKLWRAAVKSCFRPVILNDGIGHTHDCVLTPGLRWLSQRPHVHWAFPQTQAHLEQYPPCNRRVVVSPKVPQC